MTDTREQFFYYQTILFQGDHLGLRVSSHEQTDIHQTFFEFMFRLITINVLLYLLLLLEVEPGNKPMAHRAVSFEEFRKGNVLIGHFLKKYSMKTKSGCAKRCLAAPACLSFNQCESQDCELNSGDAHSENAVLEKRSSCSYFGMAREEGVICEEMGISRNVTQNSNKDRCKID